MKNITLILLFTVFHFTVFAQLGFVNSYQVIGYDSPGMQLAPGHVGRSITAIDDHNGNGVKELVFGDPEDDKNGYSTGAIWITYITSSGAVDSAKRIDQYTPNFNYTLNDTDRFGFSITTVGDLDGNGYIDLAVGAPGDDDGTWNTGAIYILFMDTNATLLNTKKISNTNGQFTPYLNGEELGTALGIGADMNLDGNVDLLVGMPYDNDGGYGRGAVLTFFLTDSGTVQNVHKISSTLGGSGFITQNNCHFGTSVCIIPDLNGDGTKDMVVGADNAVAAGAYAGGVFVCFLDSQSNVIDYQLISNGYGNLSTGISTMGTSIVNISDFNNDNLPDIAVGMRQYLGGRFLALALDTNGTVKTSNYLSIPTLYNNALDNTDEYGSGAVAFDVNGDTIIDIIGTAPQDDDGFYINSGAIYVSFLNSTGNGLLGGNKISFLFGGLESRLINNSEFAYSMDTIGDVDGDGNIDLIVGAPDQPDANVSNIATGAAYVILTNADGTAKAKKRLSYSSYPQIFGAAGATGKDVAGMGDFNGDGVPDVLIGTPSANLGGTRRGKATLIYLNADMTVQSYRTYGHGEPGFPISLDNYDNFGHGVTNLGDVDGDGITDIAISAIGDDGNGPTNTITGIGCIYVMLLNADGSVKNYKKLTFGIDIQPNFGNSLYFFGYFISAMGDIDGDGVPDLGANYYSNNIGNIGYEMSIMFLNSDGSLKGQRNLLHTEVGGTGTTINLNSSFTGGHDLNLDGVPDLVMGTPANNKYYYIYLNDTAGVIGNQLINTTNGNLNITFANTDMFGSSFAFIGDRTGDGVPELAVGAYQEKSSQIYTSSTFGAVYVLNLNSPFLVNAGNNQNTCGTIVLGGNPTAQGGTWPLTYHWSPGNLVSDSTSPNPIFIGNQQTTLTLTVTDNNGVVITDQVTVSTSPMVLSSQIANPVSCFGATDAAVNLGVTGNVGPTTFVLNNDTNLTGIFSNLPAGNYTATVIDSTGCSKTNPSFQIVQPTQVSFSFTSSGALPCANDSSASIAFSAVGGNGSYLYSIDSLNYTINSTINNLPAGTYALTVKDTSGCLADTQLTTITAPQAITLTGTSTPITCNNAQDGNITVQAQGGTGALTFSLNGSIPQTNGVFQNLDAGSYTLQAIDSNGCASNTLTFTLSNPLPLQTQLTILQNVLCNNGTTGIIQASATNGLAPFSYSLNGSTPSTSNTFSNLAAGSYSVVTNDANGCTATSTSLTLTNPTLLIGNAQITQNILCYNGNDGKVQLSASGGTPNYSYSLNGSTYVGNPVFTSVAAGSYNPTVKDQNGCVAAIGQITLSNPTQIAVTFQVSNETVAGNDGELTLIANGGAGNYTYSIDGTNYQSSPIFTGLPGGLITFYVKDGNGCIQTGNAYIDSSVGILELSQNEFNVFPNPTTGHVTVTHNSSQAVTVKIINQLGQIVFSDNIERSGEVISLNNLPPALYHVKLIFNTGAIAVKQLVLLP